MSKIENSINILGTIAPLNTEDTYPTHWAKYGKGGYVSVPNKEDIPVSRLENGMRIYETETGGEWLVEEGSPGVYTFSPYSPSGGSINRQSNIQSLTNDLYLASDSAYFQFLNPTDDDVRVLLPQAQSLDYFEFEIINTATGSNTLRLFEIDSLGVETIILSMGSNTDNRYKAVYCSWNGSQWAVWIRAFYQP